MSSTPERRMKKSSALTLGAAGALFSTPVILIAGLAAVVYIPAALSPSLQPTVIQMLVDLIIVVGLFIFIGNSGILSFGHISFMAIGAYTYALLAIPPASKHIFLPYLPDFLASSHMGALPATLIAGSCAAIFGLIIAIPIMRLSGIAASIATFSVLIIVNVVISNWNSLTNGNTPVIGVPLTTTQWSGFVWAALFLVVAFVFKESRIGLRLRASREDLVAARAVGIGIYLERILAMVLSAFCVGIAGALFAGSLGSFSPVSFYLDATILTLAMLVVGGMVTLSGAWLGAIVISALNEFLRRLTEGMTIASVHVTAPSGTTQVGVAAALLLILIFRPAGLSGGREVTFPCRLRSRRVESPDGVHQHAVLTPTDSGEI